MQHSNDFPTLEEISRELHKRDLLDSHLSFTQEMFYAKEGMEFLVAQFHRVLCDTLDKVLEGEIKRLVINVPPGYGKTELAVINFIARGFALNPKSRFIHASYAEPLALDNSSKVKDTLSLEEFQKYWPIQLRKDTTAKGLWRTTEGGGLRAASAGSPITGFRAGYMDPDEFTGALIIDDPLKPDDALSEKLRKFINARYMNTFRSRLAHEGVPVIVIMQRLHVEDFSAHLLNGGSGEKWHHLCLPVEITDNNYEDFSHSIPIEYDLEEGPLWTEKHDEEQIEQLSNDDYVTQAQYYQRPTALGGSIFKEEMIELYGMDDIPEMQYRFLVADTALTAKTSSDYTAIGCYGWSKTKRLYLLDLLHIKKEVPEMELAAVAFYLKQLDLPPHEMVRMGNIRKFLIENKSSGIGLIQRLKKKRVPVVSVERTRDKVARSLDTTPYLSVSPLMLPDFYPWHKTVKKEMLGFTHLGSLNDDIVDTIMDAVEETMTKGLSLMDVL